MLQGVPFDAVIFLLWCIPPSVNFFGFLAVILVGLGLALLWRRIFNFDFAISF
jgi:hypothetical protein